MFHNSCLKSRTEERSCFIILVLNLERKKEQVIFCMRYDYLAAATCLLSVGFLLSLARGSEREHGRFPSSSFGPAHVLHAS